MTLREQVAVTLSSYQLKKKRKKRKNMIHRPAARTYHNVSVKRLSLHVHRYYRQAIVQSVVGVVLVLMEEPFKRAVSLKIQGLSQLCRDIPFVHL